ncbi:spore germination protein [Thalassobacillus sp. C254]|uniref:spore germination protein n=1 Tax=Thalassobacillus sp. C254 TaxID=1225341 RepID=UPI000AA26275|nr:spore germination protein [Thalassobacillus sp. C254]
MNNRLQRIDVDGTIESGMIEEFIEDNPLSPFPQILNTERPDVVASYLLEGHVCVLVDGSPSALIAPVSFYSLLQSPEDYYQRFMASTLLRWLRYFFLVIALLLPSIYVLIPFPALIEAFIMEIMFEVLREAGLRLPKQVGAAVSIVGALVIGEAAVSAGIVSSPMVMVVAITGIASFALPRYNFAFPIRMLRFPMVLLAGALGLLGVILGVLAILVHLCTLRSFGVPYLSPWAPFQFNSLKDVFYRAPSWAMSTRPNVIGEDDDHRIAKHLKPGPEKGGD